MIAITSLSKANLNREIDGRSPIKRGRKEVAIVGGGYSPFNSDRIDSALTVDAIPKNENT
jgi:hypothetical protein